LWRNEADQEPGGSPTMDLDYQYVLITCTVGKIRFGALELSAGESVWITSDTTLTPPSPAPTYIFEGTSIPLVGGDGDQSGSPPAFLGGTLAVQALCVDPVDGVAGVSFYAKIAWSEEAAYHVLYGQMLECYDLPASCQVDCGGTATSEPNELYLTVSNQSDTVSGDVPNLEGSYVLDKSLILSGVPVTAFCGYHDLRDTHLSAGSSRRGTTPETGWLTLFVSFGPPGQGGAGSAIYDFETVVCGGSDSGSVTINILGPAPDYANVGTITFDWELST
jgi:hypothetical protein